MISPPRPLARGAIAAAILFLARGQALAQDAGAAVPVMAEPHHHLAYSDDHVRLFQVEVPAHTATLLHQHDRDYVWVALGNAAFVNAVAAQPEARVVAADASVHFSRGGFAHVARNESASDFRNVTIELLQAQSNPRNLCDQVIAAQPTACPAATSQHPLFGGVSVRPAFQTDQMRVSILRLEPRGSLKVPASANPPLLVALDSSDADVTLSYRVTGEDMVSHARLRRGSVHTASTDAEWELRNPGGTPIRFLAMEWITVGR